MNIYEKIKAETNRYSKINGMGLQKKQPIQEMNMRDMLRRMRKQEMMKEVEQTQSQSSERPVTPMEEKQYQERMMNYFRDDNVNIEFDKLLVHDEGIFWGGTVDGQFQFTYMVTPNQLESKAKINYLDGFDKNDPENSKIVDKINAYYDEFYKYWRENELRID